jgi:RNA polymerase sigma factor (TIGR02999 family)
MNGTDDDPLPFAGEWPDGLSDRLFDAVYDELKRVARSQLRRLRPGQLMDTTSLVHETYFKFERQTDLEVRSRDHFLAVAARAMHQVLVDYARRTHRLKRAGGGADLQLDETLSLRGIDVDRVLDVDRAVRRLAEHSSRQAFIVQCRFFAGLTEEEVAAVLGVSSRTVRNEWARAKAWLALAMRAPEPPPEAT